MTLSRRVTPINVAAWYLLIQHTFDMKIRIDITIRFTIDY